MIDISPETKKYRTTKSMNYIIEKWCPYLVLVLLLNLVRGYSYDYPLDLVLVYQHQGEETKMFFRLLPQYFDLHENGTRVAVVFANSQPYVGLNFTHDDHAYQKSIEQSVAVPDDWKGNENEVEAFQITAQQLFATSNGSSKAMVFIQYGLDSEADNELIQLRSMGVLLYVICPLDASLPLPQKRFARAMARECGQIGRLSDCTFMILDPGILHGEVFKKINETIGQKYRNTSSVCGNGAGFIVINSGVDINQAKTELVSTSEFASTEAIGQRNSFSLTISIITLMLMMLTTGF